MIFVPTDKLEPSMVVGAHVRHPDLANHVLLETGYHMEEETISHLRRFCISGIWIRQPGFDFHHYLLVPTNLIPIHVVYPLGRDHLHIGLHTIPDAQESHRRQQ